MFQDDAVAVKALADVGRVLDFGGNDEAERCQLPHLPQQRHEPLAVVDAQLAVAVVQLHQAAVGLQAKRTRC